jgi:hypothetical protein
MYGIIKMTTKDMLPAIKRQNGILEWLGTDFMQGKQERSQYTKYKWWM